MRTAFNSDFITVEKNGKPTVVGIFTGADFCAEHEWGIKKLQTYLGMDDTKIGVEKRRIRNTKYVHFDSIEGKANQMAYLVMGDRVEYAHFNPLETVDKLWKRKRATNKDENLYCAWDESGVLVAVKGKEQVALLKGIHKSIMDGNGYLALGGQGAFNNGGLTLIDINDIPDDKKKLIEQADLDRIALLKASDDTGIIAKLKATWTDAYDYPASGCKYFACSPRWANEKEKGLTKYPVVYWLNPHSQHLLNFGWFTVEDLEQWIIGEGKILKSNIKTQTV
jgi:hypothetical protein